MTKTKEIKNKYGLFVDNKTLLLTEQFKSETPLTITKVPEELGETHPFDFKELEEIYKRMGLVTAVIDKYVDFIVGPGFYVTSDNPKAKKIIEDFMHDVNFDTILRQWVRQALIKGSSPMELGLSKGTITGLKVLNANYIYIKRNNKGEVEGFNQYTGDFKKNGVFTKSKVIPFTPQEIAFLTFNQVGDSPYGIGILNPVLNTLNNLLKSEKDMHILIGRKANSPLHIKLGNMDKEDIPTDEEVQNFGQKLEYMTNKQEWCTGPNVEMSVVDFGNLSEKFSSVIEHDMRIALYSFQIPEVIMGEGNIPEGLAGVQMDAWQRRIGSYQAEIEKIVELQIFDRILNFNGIDANIELEWGQPSNQEKNDKIMKITALMNVPTLSNAMLDELELQLAELLGVDPRKLLTPEAQREKEEKRSQVPVPGQKVEPGRDAKPKEKEEKEEPEEKHKFYSKEWCEGELIHED